MANIPELFSTDSDYDEMAAASWQQDLAPQESRPDITDPSKQTAQTLGHLCMHCDEQYLYS